MIRFFAILVFIAQGTAFAAQSPTDSETQTQDTALVDEYFDDEVTFEEGEGVSQNANCHAYTSCPYGAPRSYVQCQTYGSGCTWYTSPGNYVRCRGYNNWGNWVSISVSCWR